MIFHIFIEETHYGMAVSGTLLSLKHLMWNFLVYFIKLQKCSFFFLSFPQTRTDYNLTWHKSTVLEDDSDTITVLSVTLIGKRQEIFSLFVFCNNFIEIKFVYLNVSHIHTLHTHTHTLDWCMQGLKCGVLFFFYTVCHKLVHYCHYNYYYHFYFIFIRNRYYLI